MNIKEMFERLKEAPEYVYVAIPAKKIVAEFTDREVATAYASTFNGTVFDIFPYEEYGFEDPYNFTNEWTVLNEAGDIIKYEVSDENIVVEAVVG